VPSRRPPPSSRRSAAKARLGAICVDWTRRCNSKIFVFLSTGPNAGRTPSSPRHERGVMARARGLPKIIRKMRLGCRSEQWGSSGGKRLLCARGPLRRRLPPPRVYACRLRSAPTPTAATVPSSQCPSAVSTGGNALSRRRDMMWHGLLLSKPAAPMHERQARLSGTRQRRAGHTAGLCISARDKGSGADERGAVAGGHPPHRRAGPLRVAHPS
jgi:hypothetical protein